MKKRHNYTLPALGILAGLAATLFTGGAAAPLLAGEVAAEGAGAAAAGGALAEGAGAAAGAGGLAGGAEGAFGAALGAAPEGVSGLAASMAAPGAATPSITGALSASSAPGALSGAAASSPSAAGIFTNPSDLAFQGSKLYNPAEVGQTVPGAFPGSKFGDMAQMNPAGSAKGPMDYFRMAQQMKGMASGQKPQQMPMPSAPHAQPQQQQSNQDIYKKYLQMSDPVTYNLLYGGGSGGFGGVGGYF